MPRSVSSEREETPSSKPSSKMEDCEANKYDLLEAANEKSNDMEQKKGDDTMKLLNKEKVSVAGTNEIDKSKMAQAKEGTVTLEQEKEEDKSLKDKNGDDSNDGVQDVDEESENTESEGRKYKPELNTEEERRKIMTSLSETVEGFDELSKRQQKKLLKQQMFLETKADRRKYEREKQRKKMEALRASGQHHGNFRNHRKFLKQVTMAASACKQRVAVDMSFDDMMMEKHLCQCVKQLSRCYSSNRRTQDPTQLYITSFTGKCKDILARQNGYQFWDVNYEPRHFTEVFPKEQIVYLTSESDNVLSSLNEDDVYIIGGLVDHNKCKGHCHDLAVKKGLRHAKLPIDEYIDMKTRKVLTVDHVFRIIIGVAHGMSWKDAFLDIIPARKGAVGKDDGEDGKEDNEGEIEEEEEENEEEMEGEETKNGEGRKKEGMKEGEEEMEDEERNREGGKKGEMEGEKKNGKAGKKKEGRSGETRERSAEEDESSGDDVMVVWEGKSEELMGDGSEDEESDAGGNLMEESKEVREIEEKKGDEKTGENKKAKEGETQNKREKRKSVTEMGDGPTDKKVARAEGSQESEAREKD